MPVATYAADEIESDDWDDEECDHIWEKAMCTEPATCEICGETKGKKLRHTTKFGLCERCEEYQGKK